MVPRFRTLLLTGLLTGCPSPGGASIGDDTPADTSGGTPSTMTSAMTPTTDALTGSTSGGPGDSTGSASSSGPDGSETTGDVASSTGMGSSSESGGGSSSTGDGALTLCEETGGRWHVDACGHATCGVDPTCRNPEGGCNCGDDQSFDVAEGCFVDRRCAPATFACDKELSCTVGEEFCVLPASEKLVATCVSMPAECVKTPDCECLAAAGVLDADDMCMDVDDGGIVVEPAQA